jgi:transposase
MGYSSDVTDKEWEIIEPLLPQKKKTRPPVWTKRQILNGISIDRGYHPDKLTTALEQVYPQIMTKIRYTAIAL